MNEVRLLSLGALRHHSSDCLRQRPSVGGYSSQFARTLLRLCFAKLLVLLVGGPDDATACAPYGARPVASGNLTTSSQVHLVAGASRAHPTRRLRRGRISWRCGDWEFGRRSKTPSLTAAKATESICLPNFRGDRTSGGFRQVVRRDGLEVGERVGECENALTV